MQIRVKKGHVLLTRKLENLGFPKIKTNLAHIKGVRIVPFGDCYNIELLYHYDPIEMNLNKMNVLGVDLGLTNIVTTSDTCGGTPLIIKGGVLKSVNQFYNKELSKYKSLAKKCNHRDITNRILKIHRKRNNKVRDFFHKTSRKIINHCIANNIGIIIVGYNERWKQNINLGKKTNQTFV